MKRCCNIKDMDSCTLFVCGARLAFGAWLFYVGLAKWIGGASGFIGYISGTFADTWLPAALVVATGWIIIISEPLLGLWLLSGRCQRMAWLGSALLMFLLLMGQTILKQHATVANIWQFLVLALVCASLSCTSCEQQESCSNE